MPKQNEQQRETIERVMHEFKEGELKTGAGKGPKVKNPKQAIAIALHEAGATRNETSGKNRKNLKRTKAKEERGETAEAEKEGKAAQDRTLEKGRGRASSRKTGGHESKSALYDEAKRQGISGRSKMSKQELERVLHH